MITQKYLTLFIIGMHSILQMVRIRPADTVVCYKLLQNNVFSAKAYTGAVAFCRYATLSYKERQDTCELIQQQAPFPSPCLLRLPLRHV